MSLEASWKAALWPGAAALAGIAAYWPLLASSLLSVVSGTQLSEVEQWFFAPATTPVGLTLAVAAWMTWRRMRQAPVSRASQAPACWLGSGLLLTGSAALYAGGQHTGAPHLLCLSLVLGLLATGGQRNLLAPAVVVLLAVPIPYPLYNEVVWALQRWTASGALWLMQAAGLEATGFGVALYFEGATFLVIEECSGLRSMRTLLIAAFVLGDLTQASFWRHALLLVFTPVLSLGLNIVRVAIIAADPPDPLLAQGSGHVGQGIGTLVIGTALLYLLSQLWRVESDPPPKPVSHSTSAMGRWPRITLWFAALLLLSVVIPSAPERPPAIRLLDAIPLEQAGWKGSELDVDRLFLGDLPVGLTIHRRYEVVSDDDSMQAVIQLFVAGGVLSPGSAALYSPKLALPGRAWTVERHGSKLDGDPDEHVTVTLASRGEQRALIYYWTVGDRGSARENLRSLLALDFAAGAELRPRGAVRISTPLGDHPKAVQRAARRLNRFVRDFGAFLAEAPDTGPAPERA